MAETQPAMRGRIIKHAHPCENCGEPLDCKADGGDPSAAAHWDRPFCDECWDAALLDDPREFSERTKKAAA